MEKENIETLLAAVAQTQGFAAVGTASGRESENSETTSTPVVEINGSEVRLPEPPPPPVAISAEGQVNGTNGKRKRGRPRKGKVDANPQPPKQNKVENEEEEDVCFICFDGGSLVLCDRKGCPKAYHPACIKRDEAFFNSDAKWTCGWHICSVCRKTSHYKCYTCTYSLCKACTKDADYVCVRGNKGFCSICMKTIMLIENKAQANDEAIQVDFDDQGCWEYLFKWYWSCLKERLSLTLSDLTQAKSPWKGSPTVACTPQLSNVGQAAADGKISRKQRSMEHLELNKPQVGTISKLNDEKRTTPLITENYEEKQICKKRACSKVSIKQTMEKVADEPAIRKVSKQPRIEKDQDRPCNGEDTENQRICGNINNQEADKPVLASSPDLASNKENLDKSSLKPVASVSSTASEMVVGGIICLLSPKLKKQKKSEDKGPQNNLDEYAAIDVHNIKLIYLRRNSMVNLLEDQENFNSNVIGSIVRIRSSSNFQKPDVYRLVQVVGTMKVDQPYTIGERTVNIVLEVLNLDKKETVTIDAISDQEFTKEECKWLCQTIKCGLGNRLTVGEVQRKALALKPVRIDDGLEAEILKLNLLRDQASEKGRKKRLREYNDRLELLKSPVERQRRIAEAIEIHADPKMSPYYDLDDGEYVTLSSTRLPRNGRKSTTRSKKGNGVRSVQLRKTKVKTEANGSLSSDQDLNQVNIIAPSVGGRDDPIMQVSGLPASTPSVSVGNSSPKNIETEKLWHYRDPTGRIQGPFSMVQLRMWSTTGLFPVDMRIWTNHEQYDSLLLSDALSGHLHGELELSQQPSTGSKEDGPAVRIGAGEGTDVTNTSKQEEVAASNAVGVQSGGNSRRETEKECETSWPHCWDLLKDKNTSANCVQESTVLPPSSSEKTEPALPVRGQENDESNSCLQNGRRNLSGLVEGNFRSQNIDLNLNDNIETGSVVATDSNSPDLGEQVESTQVPDPHAPVEKPAENQPSSIQVPDLHAPIANATENQPSVTGILELLSPAPRVNNDDQETHATETKSPGPLNFPLPDSDLNWTGASGLLTVGPDIADEWPLKPPVQEWNPGLVPASSLKPEVANEYVPPSASDGHQITPDPPNLPSWLEILNGPIELDALGEESVSDLLAEVDAMGSQGASLPSPTSAANFAKEFLEDCKDDCFSSIGDFSPTPDPQKCLSLGATQHIQNAPCKLETFDLDSFRKSSVNSYASSEGETSAPDYSSGAGSEIRPPESNQTIHLMNPAPTGTGSAPDAVDHGWGTVQGNINMLTVQGNVNLVLGGPGQGMPNLGWGTNNGTPWVNPNLNHNPINASLPWDGQHKHITGERYTSPRERGYLGNDSGFGRGRPPTSRQNYGTEGYSWPPPPRGQRICKFYESGRCKKGAYCEYMHP